MLGLSTFRAYRGAYALARAAPFGRGLFISYFFFYSTPVLAGYLYSLFDADFSMQLPNAISKKYFNDNEHSFFVALPFRFSLNAVIYLAGAVNLAWLIDIPRLSRRVRAGTRGSLWSRVTYIFYSMPAIKLRPSGFARKKRILP